MYFIIMAEDRPDSLELRMATRPSHLDYAAAQGCVVLAGPLLADGKSSGPQGSMLIIDVADRASAEKFAANDPYAVAGLFARLDITPWMPAFGPWKPEDI